MTADTNARMEKGKTIAQLNGQVKRIDAHSYRVRSQSNDGEYQIISSELGWLCSCADHVYRGQKCKHIFAVEFSQTVRKAVETRKVEPIVITDSCIFCNSTEIVKDGIRRNKHGNIQKFNCKACSRYFTINIGFEKMKHNPQAITAAMQLYFSGESLRNTMRSLRLIGIEVSHQTVWNWIEKYCTLMQDYIEKLKPQVSDTWRADELWIKVKGDLKYVFALMDDETRYWIAQEVADTKHRHDARSLFHMGKEVMGKKPMTIITDGLKSYHDAYKREFFTIAKPRTEHVKGVMTAGEHTNNKMERLNGEIRGREKVMRGLKHRDTPILKGMQVFHNAIKPHEGLNGQTPLEACGVKVEGKDKWLTIIQNASHPTTFDRRTNQPQT